MCRYLCSERSLVKPVVMEMIKHRWLYQSVYTTGFGKALHNATFVYLNAEGKAIGAYQRGLRDQPGQPAYKRDVPGSDKSQGWLLQGTGEIHTVNVYEGAIDAASEASLQVNGQDDSWRAGIDRLSLEGVGYQPLRNYLQAHPNVREVTLMLDADQAGRNAVKQITASLQTDFPGITINDVLPMYGKDWNNTICEVRSMETELSASVPEQEI